MTQFNQQGQQVQSQHNIGRDMNVGAVQSSEDLIDVLERLNKEFAKAKDAGDLTEEAATDAQYHVTKAVQQAKKSDPDKKSIVDHLTAAKNLVLAVPAATALAQALTAAIPIVLKLL